MKTVHSRSKHRTATGSIVEFGAAIAILIPFVLVPLIALCSVPCRYVYCQGVLNELAMRVSHCEKPSEAESVVKGTEWKRTLESAGVSIINERLRITAVTSDGSKQYSYSPGQAWPKEWLPDQSPPKTPFVYALTVSCTCRISIPGINVPINVPVAGHGHWDNLARDPKSTTLAYYLEE